MVTIKTVWTSWMGVVVMGFPLMVFAQNKGVAVGDFAPDFQLLDQKRQLRSLKEFRGQKVVVYFYPKDDTPGCTKEACSFRDSYELYRQHGIVVIGISYDTPESHQKFAEKYQLPFILLADTAKTVAKMYGAYGGMARWFFPKRMTFLIDESGKVVHVFRNVDVTTHAREVLKVYGIPLSAKPSDEDAEQE